MLHAVQTIKPSKIALDCRSCGSTECVQVTEFKNVPCDCGVVPFPHPHAEPVCHACRTMLMLARARRTLWENRN